MTWIVLAHHPLAAPGEFRAEVLSLILIGAVVGLLVYGTAWTVALRREDLGDMTPARSTAWVVGMLVVSAWLGAGTAEILLPAGHERLGAMAGAVGTLAGGSLWSTVAILLGRLGGRSSS